VPEGTYSEQWLNAIETARSRALAPIMISITAYRKWIRIITQIQMIKNRININMAEALEIYSDF